MSHAIDTLVQVPVTGRWKNARLSQTLRHDRAGQAGLVIVVLFLLLALLAWSGLAGQGWSQISGQSWEAPSTRHWLGTNMLGQDIFDRTVVSAGVAFRVGIVVAALATLLGALLGAMAGWYHRSWLDELVLWLLGVLDSIPFYLFVAAVAFAMHGNSWAMQVAMIATFWTGTARLVRGEVLRLKQREFVESARAIGLPGHRILVRHVLPNTSHLLLVQATLTFVAAIKTEVILSFLGLGISDGISWGLMLAESTQEVLAGQFGNFFAASGCLLALLMGFNLLADCLQDALELRDTAL